MVKEESQRRADSKNKIKLITGDGVCENEYSYPWGVLHQRPLSTVKLLRNSVPCAHSCAAGCFTGSSGESTTLAPANVHC